MLKNHPSLKFQLNGSTATRPWTSMRTYRVQPWQPQRGASHWPAGTGSALFEAHRATGSCAFASKSSKLECWPTLPLAPADICRYANFFPQYMHFIPKAAIRAFLSSKSIQSEFLCNVFVPTLTFGFEYTWAKKQDLCRCWRCKWRKSEMDVCCVYLLEFGFDLCYLELVIFCINENIVKSFFF